MISTALVSGYLPIMRSSFSDSDSWVQHAQDQQGQRHHQTVGHWRPAKVNYHNDNVDKYHNDNGDNVDNVDTYHNDNGDATSKTPLLTCFQEQVGWGT